jgi:replication factor A1
MAQLSRGCLAYIKKGAPADNPILQILDIKGVNTQAAHQPMRFRLQLWDGVENMTGMLATQLNHLVADNTLTENTIIRVTGSTPNTINGAILLIILSLEVLGQGAPTAAKGGAQAPAGALPPSYASSSFNQPPPAAAHQPYGGAGPPFANAPNPYAAAGVGAGAVPSYASSSYPPPAAYGGGAAAIAPSYGANPYAASVAPPAAVNPYAGASNPYGGYGAGGSGAVVKDRSAGEQIHPISAINPYSSKWTIKARITAKSEMRRWSNAKGEGTLFSIDLLDSEGGEIRATFFKDACEKFFPMLEEGKVYTFSGGVLKVVQNKQYSNLKNNYELTFNANAEIRAVADDSAIKVQHFAFTKIASISMLEPGNTVDVIGIVKSASECSEITSTKLGGKQLLKRDLTLIDDSGCEIKLTLWGEKAQSAAYQWETMPIAAFKGLKIGDYGGRSLSSMNTTTVMINPMIPEGKLLHAERMKYPDQMIPMTGSLSASGGAAGSMDTIEKRKTIASIRDEGMGLGEKPDYCTVKGTVVYIKHDNDPWYTACPTVGCNKKVVEGFNGQWSCEKCNKTFDTCARRYVMSISMSDHTGSNWFSLFNEHGEKLLGGITAQQLFEWKTEGNEALFEKTFSDALFKTVIAKIRVKQEEVKDESRVKSSFIRVDEVDFVAEGRQMLEAIAKYN